MTRPRTVTQEIVSSATCRKCMQKKRLNNFYQATDKLLDTNGKMSICINCCGEIYNNYFSSELNMNKALFKTCRTLNVRYDDETLSKLQTKLENMEKKGKIIDNAPIFGFYINLLTALTEDGKIGKNRSSDLTFQPIDFSKVAENSLEKFVQLDEDAEYLEQSWGLGLEIEDYLFLEDKFAKWKRTTKCDTYSEELLVRELCHKENEIRHARLEGKSTDNLVKALQEIMKNSALTPSLQNAASSGRSADAFGVWVKDIESLTPAEWYENQDKYRDIEGIDDYNQKYITRPLKNFITGSRDFNVSEIIESNSIYDEDE